MVGLRPLWKKLPLLEYKSNIWYCTVILVTAVTVVTVVKLFWWTQNSNKQIVMKKILKGRTNCDGDFFLDKTSFLIKNMVIEYQQFWRTKVVKNKKGMKTFVIKKENCNKKNCCDKN